MQIAVVGSGIAGLTTAYYLTDHHEVTVFEKNDYIGGHTNTIEVNDKKGPVGVDTGFIVFNDRTYPRFKRLMTEVGVTWRDTEMSFSVQDPESGLEYNGHTLLTLFAQKRNLFRPKFYRLLKGIVTFNEAAKKAAQENGDNDHITLGEFIDSLDLDEQVAHYYLLPMISAIWSSSIKDAYQFPLGFFLRFFLNHGLLDISNRPQWHTIEGGSSAYIPKLTAKFNDRIRLSQDISEVRRTENGASLTFLDGHVEQFDRVVFACHSDQALALLADANDAEKRILGSIPYKLNEVVLHTDRALLPLRKAAWASWNYRLRVGESAQREPSSVTYSMNILQGLKTQAHYLVTLNNSEAVDPDKVIKKLFYAHPQYSTTSMAARKDRDLINGHRNTYFCGAYWYSGFHEDGVHSAIDVVNMIAPELNVDNG